jgi:hypothetical protein
MSPNVAWSGSLESYHPYLQPQKVSKIPKIECILSGLPKTAKSHFGHLGPLGVKISAQVRACYQSLPMQQNLPKNCPKLPKFAKICPKTKL